MKEMTGLTSCVHWSQCGIIPTSLKIGYNDHKRQALTHIRMLKIQEFIMILKMCHLWKLLGHQFIILKTSKEKEFIYPACSVQKVIVEKIKFFEGELQFNT